VKQESGNFRRVPRDYYSDTRKKEKSIMLKPVKVLLNLAGAFATLMNLPHLG